VSAPSLVHALVDLSGIQASADAWAQLFDQFTQSDDVAGLARDVTCVVDADTPRPVLNVPGRWRWANAPATEAAAEAIARAGRSGAHLLVLIGPMTRCAEAAVSLARGFESDPLFGAVHPRFAAGPGGGVLPVEASSANGHVMPRSVLVSLPAQYLLAEYFTRCFMLRRELLANLETSASGEGCVADVVREYLRRARRLGYRSVVLNSVVVALPDGIDPEDAWPDGPSRLEQVDSNLARARFQRTDAFERERRLSAIHEHPRRLLFDARNLGTTVNGTSKAVLGLADALSVMDGSRWRVTLVASKEAVDAHKLEARFADWTVANTMPSTQFAAAFRPCQPWDLAEILEFHRLAAVNVYLMLDTIAWDVVYTAPRRLDATWRFAAQYADGLLFISEFSRQRFLARFPTHADVMTGVCHLSLDPNDYVDPTATTAPGDQPYWLVFGNDYDHKHVRPTMVLLTRAFPTTHLVTLGSQARGAHMSSPVSGQADEADVQRLYANAELVVFPSFYEGFGLPIINAMAYGKAVVARDSALLREIADAYCGPGRLVPYSTPDELIERLTCLRHARPVPELALRRDQAVHNWRAAARIVYDALDRLAAPQGLRREPERHEVAHLLDACVDVATSK
jgi:glycosyltransferase involved in cell wall biosynthesis